LGNIPAGTSASISSGVLAAGLFTHLYDFTSIGNVGIGAFITNLSVNFGAVVPSITNFGATLDGTPLTFTSTPNSISVGTFTFNTLFQVLAGGTASNTATLHNLAISGTALAGASYAGSVAVAAVPLPAGVWLFMTGLMGVLYTGKKKAQQA
jgi:hypothetical protein